MRRWMIGALIFSMVSYNLPLFADSTDVANEATVSVVDRSPEALQQGLKTAFGEVLVRMSGNPQIMSRPAIQKVALSVTQWVESYSYLDLPGTGTNAQPELFLQVVFDADGLRQLLQQTPQQRVAASKLSMMETDSSTVSNDDATVSNAPSASNDEAAAVKASDTADATPSDSGVVMIVSGVKGIADHAQIVKALKSVPDVERVSVREVTEDQMAIQLKLSDNRDHFQQLLASNQNFKLAESEFQTTPLQYFWIGNQT